MSAASARTAGSGVTIEGKISPTSVPDGPVIRPRAHVTPVELSLPIEEIAMKTLLVLSLGLTIVADGAYAQCTDDFILVSTTDFSTGSTSSLDPTDKTPTLNVEPIHSDAVVREFDGRIYVVNLAGADNIQILDPCNNFDTVHSSRTATARTRTTSSFEAPRSHSDALRHDDAVEDEPTDRRHARNRQTGYFRRCDGIPEMDQMFVDGNVLRHDPTPRPTNFYSPVAQLPAVIDLTTDTLVDMDPAPVASSRSRCEDESLFRSDYRTVARPRRLLTAWDSLVCWRRRDRVRSSNPPCRRFADRKRRRRRHLDVEIISATKARDRCDTVFHDGIIAFNRLRPQARWTMYAPGGYDLNDIERRSSPLGGQKGDDPASVASIGDERPLPAGRSTRIPPFDILVRDRSTTDVALAPAAMSLGPNPNPFNPQTSILSRWARTGV